MADRDTFSGFPREGREFLTTLGTKDKASFVDWCMIRLLACADLHHWLTASL